MATHVLTPPLHCNSCGDEAHDAADALARAWVPIGALLWLCPPCDAAPRCRGCDAIAPAEGRLCARCGDVTKVGA